MTLILISITLVIFIASWSIYGPLPYPTGITFLCVFCESYIFMFNLHIVRFDMLEVFDYGGTYKNEFETVLIFFLISLFSFLSFIGYNKKGKSVAEDFSAVTDERYLTLILRPLVIFVVLHFFVFIIFSDLTLVWSNSQYLSDIANAGMTDFNFLGIGSAAIRALPLMLIITAVATCVALRLGSYGTSLLSGSISLFYFLLMLGLHSRSAAFSPMVVAAVAYAFRSKHYRVVVPLCVLLGILSINIAISGRGSAYQGISALPGDLFLLFSNATGFMDLAGQLAQGAFVLAESLVLEPDFSLRYKILSFSPFPSFIDGFNSILFLDQVRLHTFVPMTGIGEIIHFGPIFIVVAAATLLLLARACILLSERNMLLFTLVNFLCCLGVYATFAYPVRTGFRFIWLSLAICLIGIIFSKPKERRDQGLRKTSVRLNSRLRSRARTH